MIFTTSSATLLFGQQHNHQLSCLSLKHKVIFYPSLSSNPSVCWVIHVQLFATPWTQHARLPCPSLFPGVCSNPCPLMPSNYFILCCPLLFLLSIFPSIKVFSNEPSLCIRWPKYCSFSFIISPSNECSGLISFRIDWYDLSAVQGILKTVLQHHHSKIWILRHSAFFMVKLSHLYMTTGKTIALTTRTFVGKVIPQLVLSMYSPDVSQILPLFSNFTLLIFF